jgi:regulator of protease activity HflC (stomatin/prohibitin superfamily)
MRSKLTALLFVLPLILLSGCTERVPPGYVGMVMQPGGLTGEALAPGNHSCYNRDRMVLIETKEATLTENLSVLCADDLNFKFDLKVRARPRSQDAQGIKDLLNRQGANIQWTGGAGVLKFDYLYNTYVAPEARSIARGIVSKYETTQIRENREAIQGTIHEQLVAALKGTPMQIASVVTSNFDYPPVITEAMEKKRKREIAIGEEEAKQAMELLKATNRLKIAQKMKITRTAEAQAEAAYVKILAGALGEKYLRLRRIEADALLYGRVEAGDKVIVGGPAMPIVDTRRNPQ